MKRKNSLVVVEIKGVKFRISNEPFIATDYAYNAIMKEERFEPLRQEIIRLSKK
jgi:hydrogenase maturation factor HypE